MWRLVLIFILVCIVVVGINACGNHNAKKDIEAAVTKRGGDLIDVQRRNFGVKPFIIARNERVYRFIYTLDGQKYVGWVKFSLGKKYKWEYQKIKGS